MATKEKPSFATEITTSLSKIPFNFKQLHTVRWVARVTGIILSLIILLFLTGEGVPDFSKSGTEEIILFAALVTMIAGTIFALKWELAGGIIIIAGYILFAVTDGKLIAGPVFPFFFADGVLYIIYWWNWRKYNRID